MITKYTVTEIDTTPQIDPYHQDTSGETLTTLFIDPRDKTVKVTQEYDDNATPVDEWNGLVIAQTLHARPNEAHARAELTDSDLVQRVLDGWSSDWNDQSNLVGRLTDDANAALEEIIENLQNIEPNQLSIWQCADWFGPNSDSDLGIAAETTDADIKILATRYAKDALADDVILADDIEDYLSDRRISARDAVLDAQLRQ